MNPTVIIGRVKQILNYYKAKGVKPERMFYMTPYPPSNIMVQMVA